MKRLSFTVSLIGFSGCGKSTLGKSLAKSTGVRFFDTDALIESRAGVPIDKLLKRGNEKGFRALEYRVIAEVYSTHTGPKVVALGGGAFGRSANRKIVGAAGPVVYLSCSVRELYRRLSGSYDRPMLRVQPREGESLREARLSRISDLLNERKVVYESADYRISVTDRPVQENVIRLLKLLERIDADRAR